MGTHKAFIVMIVIGCMIACIVSVDLLHFKDRFWERLMANIGIVLIFGVLYLRLFM